MPEGHSVHRIARQFARHFLGVPVAVSSPQGRFAADARRIDGHEIVDARAVGKQMFLEFDNGLWLRVHLGIYGAWDFAGDVTVDAATANAGGRMGQTGQKGPPLRAAALAPVRPGDARDHEESLASIGAPRRLRMSESERLGEEIEGFPPEPIGQVRVRLLTDRTVADLRGPTACEVVTGDEVHEVMARLGPDPLVDRPAKGEQRMVETIRTKPTPIALLLMDQSVVSGIGNVYRAELLFRARLDPFRPGRDLPEELVRELWRDWTRLLKLGVETGVMMTMAGLRGGAKQRALASRDDRHWVYHRTGLPCRVCGTPIAMQELGGRKLYWCPTDQA